MKKENNKINLGLIALIIVIIVGIGISFAYFAINVNKDKENSSVDVESGKLDIDFETDEYIGNTNAKLINDEEIFTKADKTVFSVSDSSESTVSKVYYDIYLDDIVITDNLKSDDFKWKLYDKLNPNGSDTPVLSGDFSDISTGDKIKLNSSRYVIENETENNYTLYVWLSNDTTSIQNDLLSGEFSAKVSIETVTE